jgi:adenosylcobinamide-phosphate synthase
LYRFANTLDAMWGYRNQRFQRFGTFSARADDVLNLIPARLTALCYALLGRTGAALDCWRRQASSCASPNGGPVMCSGAGALGVSLGGPTHYHGALQQRPLMGEGERAAMVDVKRGVTLVDRTVLLWAAVLLLGGSIC